MDDNQNDLSESSLNSKNNEILNNIIFNLEKIKGNLYNKAIKI